MEFIEAIKYIDLKDKWPYETMLTMEYVDLQVHAPLRRVMNQYVNVLHFVINDTNIEFECLLISLWSNPTKVSVVS